MEDDKNSEEAGEVVLVKVKAGYIYSGAKLTVLHSPIRCRFGVAIAAASFKRFSEEVWIVQK